MACADSAFVLRDRYSRKSAPMLVLLGLASLAGFDMTSALTALVLQFECQGPWRWNQLNLHRLRYYLSGDRQIIANLYEVLFTCVGHFEGLGAAGGVPSGLH